MRRYVLTAVLILFCFILLTFITDQSITVFSENKPIHIQNTVIIDAGHGGEDGGAVSCTGMYESAINLQIAKKLDDLFHLLGINTLMVRTTDADLHISGDTIAARKVSDLKERVKLINRHENAILVSIHQNQFSDSKYSGAQVFYGKSAESKALSNQLQNNINSTLCLNSRRNSKRAEGIYLLNNIHCPSIMVECGFLSNPDEEALLRSDEYQRKLCVVISATISNFLYA